MKEIIWILSLLVSPLMLQAQHQSIAFSTEKNQLNGGLPLHSETPFYIEGTLPPGIKRVELKIFKSNKNENQADFYFWKAPYQSSPKNYEIFVAYPLRSSDNYTLKFYFYSESDTEETASLRDALHENLESYVQATILAGKRGTQILSRPNAMLDHLNEIVRQGLKNYLHPLDQEFDGFSDVVKQKIDQIDGVKLNKARFNLLSKKKDPDIQDQALFTDQLKQELINLLKSETSQYLRNQMLMLVDVRVIENYPTENKPYYLPLSIGYAGTYFSGNFNNLDYGTSAFGGVSIPLGNKKFTKVLGNASVSTGVFFSNMRDSNEREISGPLIGRPIYVGLGYSLFRVLRFNAGAVLTATDVDANIQDVTLYPFVGFSAEFSLWLGLRK
ncbi:hypothetical protein [Cyclobacterium jeungdonense]|uniref:Uncharacterized protein n=1 Tax=Cyclobacterium jeungdonense TaxID=708087 RepID=A0ABT8CDY1_9BACT|nr:hypothetical protein [Cyclobacterium jeungdonense]MDN3690686.1 hypothetical protein [Cyclobacterium jeungdonense]